MCRSVSPLSPALPRPDGRSSRASASRSSPVGSPIDEAAGRAADADWTCPLTLELPVDPATAEDGRVYERSAIAEHNRNSEGRRLRSPVTGQAMGPRLTTAFAARDTIETLVRCRKPNTRSGGPPRQQQQTRPHHTPQQLYSHRMAPPHHFLQISTSSRHHPFALPSARLCYPSS
jgi:hypothetical protein